MAKKIKLTKAQQNFLEEFRHVLRPGSVAGYKPAEKLLQLGFITFSETRSPGAQYRYYALTNAGQSWLDGRR